MRTPRKHSADRRKNLSQRAVNQAVRSTIEGLEPRVLFVGSATDMTMLTPPSPNPYTQGIGPGVTLSVVVSPDLAGATPTGTVTFFSNGSQVDSPVTLVAGTAFAIVTDLPVGTDNITATYNGDATYATSTSSAQEETVIGSGMSTVGTTTTLSSSSGTGTDPSGTNLSFTAQVNPSTMGGPALTGTVQFYDGGTPISGAALSVDASGKAVYSTNGLAVGPHNITATYTGDTNYDPSTSGTVNETITATSQTATTTTLSSPDPTSVTPGTLVTFNATVAPSGATGTVQFMNNGANLGAPVALVSGTATLAVSNLPLGSNTITAVYSGDANFVGSTSNAIVETVTNSPLMSTTTTLTSPSPTTVAFGTMVTFNATVAPAGATGTVTFMSNGSAIGTPQTVTGGTASLSISTLAAGTDTITAVYNGDSTFAGSVSNAIVETVTPPALTPTTTTLSSPSPTTVAAGTLVTFNATIAPAGATGTVQFMANGVNIGTPQTVAGGMATLSTSTLVVGANNITAVYSGDSTFDTSTSNTLVETVTAGPSLTPTTTTLTSSNTTIFAGDPLTFTATIAPSAATGTVQFFASGLPLGGPQAVVGGVATLVNPPLGQGIYTITATYSGDAIYASSTVSAPITETVNPGVSSTTTTVTATPNPTSIGTTVTLTATLAPLSATGTVQFFDGATALGAPATISGGVATLAISNFALGTHSITASYAGDAHDTGSVSPAVTVTITQATPNLTLSSSAPTAPLADPVTFTATVGPAMAGQSLPTGTVTFFDGATAISGNITLSNGVATFVTSSLSVGPHNIMFTYNGDTNYVTGSASIVETIATDASDTKLTVSPNPGIYTQSIVVLTAKIFPANATGSVNFFDGTRLLGTGVVVGGGVAAIGIDNFAVGTHSLSAVYSGDTNYNPSISLSVTETISRGPSTTTVTASTDTLVYGNSIDLTADVTAPGATGTVSFYAGRTFVGTTDLNNGEAILTTTNVPVGIDAITAVYSGDSNFRGSTSSVATVVTVSQGLTVTTMIPNPTQVAIGAPVTFTITVAPLLLGTQTPTGTVTITQNGITNIATVPLDDGTATFTSTTLPLGLDEFVATYNGDGSYLTSSSTTEDVQVSTVIATTSTTTLTSTNTNPVYGGPVTFTAVVAPALASNLTPTGTVTFYDGTIALGAPITLGGGIAFFTTPSLPPGVNNITVVYNGDTFFTGSTSAPVVETVTGNTNAGVYVTTLNVSTGNAAFGAPVTLTASVTPTQAGDPLPFGGSVTFFAGGQTIGAATLSDGGVAMFATPLPAGTNEITAAYNGGGPITMSLPRMVAISSAATPSLAKANLPPAIVVGTSFHTSLPLVITNLGGTQEKGLFTIQVYLDTSKTLDANRILLTTVSKSFTLNAHKSRSFRMGETFSSGLHAGTYYVLAEVTDPTGLTNMTASKPVVIAAPFVALNAVVSATNPANIGIGQSAALFVTITNMGNEAASGLLNLTLSPSSDGTNPIVGKILGTGAINTTILPGKSKKYRVVLDTTALANGSYFPYISASLDGITTIAVGITPFTVG